MRNTKLKVINTKLNQSMPDSCPKDLICPITGLMMFNPVSAPDGETYEEEAITQWIIEGGTSPVNRMNIELSQLNPIKGVRANIEKYINENIHKIPNLLYSLYFPVKTMIEAIDKKDKILVRNLLTKDYDITNKATRYFTQFLFESKDSAHKYYTAFHYASEFGSIELVKLFIEEAVKNNKMNEMRVIIPPPSWNPIHLNHVFLDAAIQGNTILIHHCLLLGVDIDVKDDRKHQNTALHWATREGKTEAVEFLLSKGAKVDLVSCDRSIALNYAGFFGNCTAIKPLIKAGSNLSHQDRYGNTPLYDAVEQNKPTAAQLLVKYGASKHIKCFGDKPMSPLDLANQARDKSMLRRLLDTSFEQKRKQRGRIKALSLKVQELESKVGQISVTEKESEESTGLSNQLSK